MKPTTLFYLYNDINTILVLLTTIISIQAAGAASGSAKSSAKR